MPEDLDAEELVSSDRRWWIQSMEGGLRGRTGATIHAGEVDLSWYVALFFQYLLQVRVVNVNFICAEKFTEFDILNCN
jgi:hypothetical protein